MLSQTAPGRLALHLPGDAATASSLPQPPHSARSQGVRASSRRYLQQTLTKLGEDTLRIGRRLHREAAWEPVPLPPLRGAREVSAWPLDQSHDALEHSRRLTELLEKAIVQVPREVADDTATAATVADPVSPTDVIAPGPGTGLACGGGAAGCGAGSGSGSTAAPSTLPGGMNATLPSNRQEAGGAEGALLEEDHPNMPVALLAVAKVIDSWEAEIRRTADLWRVGLGEQAQMKAQEEERWDNLHRRLDLLQERLDRINNNVHSHGAKTEELEERLAAKLDDAKQHISEVAAGSTERAMGALEGSAGSSCEEIKRHVTELLAGTLEKTDGGQKSIGHQMKWLSEKIESLDKNEAFLRDTADRWQRSCEEAQGELKRAQTQMRQAREQAHQLDSTSVELREQLQKAQDLLEKATHSPGSDFLRKLKDLEGRGNIRIDRQHGKVELAKPLDFVPTNPADLPPLAVEFADALTAGALLADVAELAGLFKVAMEIQVQLVPGKGGKQDFWEQVATSQAALVAEYLGRCGVPLHTISTRGSLVAKGANFGSIALQLHPEIFPTAAAAKAVAAPSKSPKRK